jgi:hypothetical protein
MIDQQGRSEEERDGRSELRGARAGGFAWNSALRSFRRAPSPIGNADEILISLSKCRHLPRRRSNIQPRSQNQHPAE